MILPLTNKYTVCLPDEIHHIYLPLFVSYAETNQPASIAQEFRKTVCRRLYRMFLSNVSQSSETLLDNCLFWHSWRTVSLYWVYLMVFCLFTDTCADSHYHCHEKEKAQEAVTSLSERKKKKKKDTPLSCAHPFRKVKNVTRLKAIW